MYIDKIIKREALVLVVSVITLVVIIIGIAYSLFTQIDNEETENIEVGSIELSFCSDITCNNKYDNPDYLIGITTVNNTKIPNNIHSYTNSTDALNTTPYIFNIKNDGLYDAYLDIKLTDSNIKLDDTYKDYVNANKVYKDNLNIAVTNCTHIVDLDNAKVLKYSSNNGLIIDNDYINVGESITYCLWVYLDNQVSINNKNVFFTGSIDINTTYKSNN